EIQTVNSMTDIDNLLSNLGARLLKIVVAQNILKNSTLKEDYGVPVHCYLENDAGQALAEKYGYPCYGVITDSAKLLMQLDQIPDPAKEKPQKPSSGKMQKQSSPTQQEKRQ